MELKIFRLKVFSFIFTVFHPLNYSQENITACAYYASGIKGSELLYTVDYLFASEYDRHMLNN